MLVYTAGVYPSDSGEGKEENLGYLGEYGKKERKNCQKKFDGLTIIFQLPRYFMGFSRVYHEFFPGLS